jgi:hypothetical protein
MLHRNSAVLSAAVAVCLAACTVGEVPAGGDDMPTPDAPGVTSDAVPGCLPAVAGGGGDGHHNAGVSCITAACHGIPLGLDAPQYSIAGTLFTTANGVGVDGATIVVTDANNVTVMLTTRGLLGPGNFYSENLALVPPFTVQATQCPSLKQMSTPAADGNCNSCHNPAGMAGARLHL